MYLTLKEEKTSSLTGLDSMKTLNKKQMTTQFYQEEIGL